jgi:hypothetical protein
MQLCQSGRIDFVRPHLGMGNDPNLTRIGHDQATDVGLKGRTTIDVPVASEDYFIGSPEYLGKFYDGPAPRKAGLLNC